MVQHMIPVPVHASDAVHARPPCYSSSELRAPPDLNGAVAPLSHTPDTHPCHTPDTPVCAACCADTGLTTMAKEGFWLLDLAGVKLLNAAGEPLIIFDRDDAKDVARVLGLSTKSVFAFKTGKLGWRAGVAARDGEPGWRAGVARLHSCLFIGHTCWLAGWLLVCPRMTQSRGGMLRVCLMIDSGYIRPGFSSLCVCCCCFEAFA